MFVNEYQYVEGKVYTVKYGKDTVSITGKLFNGRPYRVRFWINYMKDMSRYAGKVDALFSRKPAEAGAAKKEESAN